jgi:hypothetical protein
MRTLIAGILGAIAMYVWASLAHGLTPLSTVGLQAIPNETAALDRMHANLGDKAGLYAFPVQAMSDPAALAREPSGLVAYSPPGTGGLTPARLVTEFVLELIESILAAFVIATVAGAFRARFLAAVGIGLIAAMATNFSYWNWYGFSISYTYANAFIELIKFAVAGAVIAWWLGRGARVPQP